MCITLERWYSCPHNAEKNPLDEGRVKQAVPADPATPWESWKEDDQIRPGDLGFTTDAAEPFVLVRHQYKTMIRCNYSWNRYCADEPFVRTEVYEVACPSCTGGDAFAHGIQPIRVVNSSCDLATKPKAQLHEVDCIAADFALYEELFTCLLYRYSCDQRTPLLSALPFLLTTRCCVEDLSHHDFSSGLVIPGDCDCANHVKPWSHNIARAIRQEEAWALQKDFTHDDVMKVMEKKANDNRDTFVANVTPFESQAWVAFEQSHDAIRSSMEAAIFNAAESYFRDGVAEFTAQQSHTEMYIARWRRLIDIRKWLARQWIHYPSIDPGLNPLVRQRMLETRVLPLFQQHPKSLVMENIAPASGYLDCLTPILRIMDGGWDDHRESFQGIDDRRRQVYKEMSERRAVDYKNVITENAWASSFMVRAEIPSADAAAVSDLCLICLEDIHVFLDDNKVPAHLRTIPTPCCGRILHRGCMLPLWRNLDPCPNCRKPFVNHAFLDCKNWPFEEYAPAPAGTLHGPDQDEENEDEESGEVDVYV